MIELKVTSVPVEGKDDELGCKVSCEIDGPLDVLTTELTASIMAFFDNIADHEEMTDFEAFCVVRNSIFSALTEILKGVQIDTETKEDSEDI